MKLQISFDLIDLDKAIAIGEQVAQYADIIEVGTILIYHHGTLAIERFKEAFPDKTILADTKIVDRGKEFSLAYRRMIIRYKRCIHGLNHIPSEARLSDIVEYPKGLDLEFEGIILQV